MARRPRVELEGGLYHLITRGNDRQDIFHSKEDHLKFLSLLAKQKETAPFYLYSYCLMTNHAHLLIERRAESVGTMMLRLLTGYASYYNRKYQHIGHVFQGRHKAILCQSDMYLGRLVAYIHLNPVRAKMVNTADEYPFSSQRAYLGLEPAGIVDVDPVLRLFGPIKDRARKRFADHVRAAAGLGHQSELYSPGGNDILGSDQFVDATIHRLGEIDGGRRRKAELKPFDAGSLLAAVESVFEISREDFCGSAKNSWYVCAKEAFILIGRQTGASVTELAEILHLSTSNVSRRSDAARKRTLNNDEFKSASVKVSEEYSQRIAETQA
jgi:putative transposase